MEWSGAAARSLYYFEEITKIPHGSTNTKQISDWVMDWACEHDLDAEQDAFGNVVIRKPASKGCENAPVVLMQGHLDMVAVKDDDSDHNFLTDPLKLIVEGDVITADRTTLGADDGIAVAMCLAILEDDTLVHPALEVVLTTDEEIGMIGATAMDMSDLKAKFMLNMDCDVEGEVNVSCAGGVRARMSVPVTRETVSGTFCHVELDGLAGGHSGAEIHKNRVNGIRLLMEILDTCLVPGCGIISLRGGAADNAIPAFAAADLVIPAGSEEEMEKKVLAFAENMKAACAGTDDAAVDIRVSMQGAFEGAAVIDSKIPAGVLAMPNGVQAMTEGMPGLVETSLNVGILKMTEDAVKLDTAIRSSREEKKAGVVACLTECAEKMGASVEFAGDYPGWPLIVDSPLQKMAIEAWRQVTGEELHVCAIHAGLECGLFSSRIPGLDIIAYGPTMIDIHSTRESLLISSVEKVWAFTLDLLARLAQM